jgi:NADH:ubiquinone oxidoreductase subunit
MNIGTLLFTFLHGQPVGHDSFGNRYYQERKVRAGARQRRWVRFNGPEEATAVPPEWHAWLHHTVDAPLDITKNHPWQKPHQPNRTGTALAYRPPGHDYKGGHRAAATGDYEAWSPEAPLVTGSPEAPLLTGSPEAPLLAAPDA